MKHFAFSLVVIASLVASLDVFAQERSEAPTFNNGDFWQFRVVEQGEYMKTERELNGVYEIVYTNGQFNAFKLESNKRIELNSDAGVLLGLVGQTALQHIQFPLFEGKTWTTDYVFRPRRREVDRNIRAVTKVTDFADVTVSAATFKAFKLERDARFKSVDHWNFVYYWSPQTKSVVKYEMNVLKGEAAGDKREIELIKFSSAR